MKCPDMFRVPPMMQTVVDRNAQAFTFVKGILRRGGADFIYISHWMVPGVRNRTTIL